MFLAQNADALRGEQPGDGIFRSGERLVVSQAAEYAMGSTKVCERLDHFFLRRRVPSDEISSHNDQIGFQSISDRDAAANLVRGHERADVDIGKLGNAKALESLGKAAQTDAADE